jgi:CheY-like chemotaxis protein
MVKPILLVVDDDREALRLIERDLRRKYGERYRVVGARSGREALDKLRQWKLGNESVALLLADQRMADMAGVEFLKQASTLFPDARRALLTAYTDSEAAISAIKDVRIDPRRLLGVADAKASRLPIVMFPDGTQLVQPTNAEIAKKIGLKVRRKRRFATS